MKGYMFIYKDVRLVAALIFIISLVMNLNSTMAQQDIRINKVPGIPDSMGFAGMFAGVSKGKAFCMGGTNFPDKMPWRGGVKKWYSHIFKFQDETWTPVNQCLNDPLAYGVSVSYNDEIILIGGNNELGQSCKVTGYTWQESSFVLRNYPVLPEALANMCGAIVGKYIILTGGTVSVSGVASKTCLLLDMENINGGWHKLESWPGQERMLAMCGVKDGFYYLFGGETTIINSVGEVKRYILNDAYRFVPERKNNGYSGRWERLSDMPRGLSAGAFPLPFIEGYGFLFWGGVDPVTALHTDPSTHPGLLSDFLIFHPERDQWQKIPGTYIPGRVTLPVLKMGDRWLYIGGEIRPGVRTPEVYSVF